MDVPFTVSALLSRADQRRSPHARLEGAHCNHVQIFNFLGKGAPWLTKVACLSECLADRSSNSSWLRATSRGKVRRIIYLTTLGAPGAAGKDCANASLHTSRIISGISGTSAVVVGPDLITRFVPSDMRR